MQAMMYGYGDAQHPLPDSVDFVEVLPALRNLTCWHHAAAQPSHCLSCMPAAICRLLLDVLNASARCACGAQHRAPTLHSRTEQEQLGVQHADAYCVS